ncbi:TRAP transporter substrate-binding protein DctP [Zhaonella formicivorans]|uniref:TRAP transporter substrate-binding protein DctP n=1 Tax=Zhaonella formicivorans TaxID=2528593 RepID=UPI0010D9B7D2|nr:TRAP transporter substrate-binding protein DctP [Zhaonella formicivorans]
MKKSWQKIIVLVAITLFALGLVAGCGQSGEKAQSGDASKGEEAPKEKIVLRAVTPFNQNSPEHDGFWLFTEKVKEKLGDQIEIKYLGAGDVIKAFDQFEMLGKGMFEIGHLPGNYAKNVLPVAETLHLSQLSPMDEREKGVYEILRQEFEKKMNIIYLGKTAGPGYLYSLYTNFKVNTLEDFKGKTIRTSPVYVPLLKALGAGAVSMPPGEIYSAMERKVVDGFGWPTLGIIDGGWAEVTKYRIDPGFYPVGMGVFINKDAWNKIPEDVRAQLEEIMKETEKEAYNFYEQKVADETAKIKEKGMEVIQLPPDQAEKLLSTAYEEGWKEMIQKEPELGQKLKDLTTPK